MSFSVSLPPVFPPQPRFCTQCPPCLPPLFFQLSHLHCFAPFLPRCTFRALSVTVKSDRVASPSARRCLKQIAAWSFACLVLLSFVCTLVKKVFLSAFFFGSPFSGDLGLPSRGWGKSLQWHRCPHRKCAEALAPGARAQWAASYSLLSSLIQLPTY